MFLNKKSLTPMSSFSVIYKGSTLIETDGIRGISHLGEHLMTKGLEKHINELSNNGISWNAYTSNNEIVFYIKGIEKYLAPFRDILIESLSSFDIDKKAFDKEKKIVIEEYKDSFKNQDENHYYNFCRKYLNDYSPIGSLSDLNKMSYYDMMDFYEKQYLNPHMIINVSKTNNYNDKAQTFASEESNKKYVLKPEGYDFEFDKLPGIENSTSASFIFSAPILEKTDDIYLSHIINRVLTGELNSPLYSEIREKRGLVYGLSMSTLKFNDQGLIMFGTSSDAKNIDEIIKVFKQTMKNPEKAISKDFFERIKNKIKIGLEKEEINRYSNIDRFFSKKHFLLDDKIDSITYEEILEFYKKHYASVDSWIYSVDKIDFK